MRTFTVLSRLLSYPEAELQAAARELPAVLAAEAVLPKEAIAGLGRLIEELASWPLLDLQEHYVALFDRSRSLSLHLFEHVHGESRDRGQAMVDLIDLYRRHGLDPDARELPDFLPLFLEFLSVVPLEEARSLLGQTAHILAALGDRLAKRESPYAAVLAALVAVADRTASEAEIAAIAEATPDDDSPEALDREWAEEPVEFGPSAGQSGCGRVTDMLRRMGAPGAP